MPKREAVLCESGYHAVCASSLLDWLQRDTALVFVAEGRGENHNDRSKWVFEQMRLVGPALNCNPRVARLFACDCAERVLGSFEKHYPDDNRPRRAVEVARLFAEGQATESERAAAWGAAAAAAEAAAWDAARDAAWGAARAAAWDSAWDSAWGAARAAARDSARAAARDSARDAAWGAARAAARDSAWDSAWDAAWGAVWGPARAAAWDAAWGAEHRWQARRLLAYLGGRA
jgi:hypothetical protein